MASGVILDRAGLAFGKCKQGEMDAGSGNTHGNDVER